MFMEDLSELSLKSHNTNWFVAVVAVVVSLLTFSLLVSAADEQVAWGARLSHGGAQQ